LIRDGASHRDAVAQVAATCGWPKRDVYRLALTVESSSAQ
jgi:hypothetical protein